MDHQHGYVWDDIPPPTSDLLTSSTCLTVMYHGYHPPPVRRLHLDGPGLGLLAPAEYKLSPMPWHLHHSDRTRHMWHVG